jgi:hypothetical protein
MASLASTSFSIVWQIFTDSIQGSGYAKQNPFRYVLKLLKSIRSASTPTGQTNQSPLGIQQDDPVISFLQPFAGKENVKADEIVESDLAYSSSDPFAFLSTLFGIPTRNFKWGASSTISSAENFFRNLFRWHHPSAPMWQKVLNYTLIPSLLAFGWHAIKAVPTLAVNLVYFLLSLAVALAYIVSGFVTGALTFIFGLLNNTIQDAIEKPADAIKWGIPYLITGAVAVANVISFIALTIGFVLFAFVQAVLFHPLLTIKALWTGQGEHPIFSAVEEYLKQKGYESKVNYVGRTLAILGLLIGVTAFALLALYTLPLLISFITVAAPAIFPAFIATGLNAALGAFTSFAILASAFFAPIGAVVGSILPAIGSSAVVTEAVLGLTFITGALLPVIGSLISFGGEKLADWYYKLSVDNYFGPVKPSSDASRAKKDDDADNNEVQMNSYNQSLSSLRGGQSDNIENVAYAADATLLQRRNVNREPGGYGYNRSPLVANHLNARPPAFQRVVELSAEEAAQSENTTAYQPI